MGKNYQAFTRFNSETLRRDISLEDRLLTDDLLDLDDLTPFEENVIIASESANQPADEEKIFDIKGSVDRKKKFLSQLNVSAIRQIFSYNCFLSLKEPIRARKINLFQYKNFVFYRALFETQIKFSVYLDRAGDFLSVNISPERLIPNKENSLKKPTVLERSGFEKTVEHLIQKIFKDFDFIKLESLLKDLFSIEHFQKISCEGGQVTTHNDQLLYEFIIISDIMFSLLLNPTGDFLGISFLDDTKIYRQIISEHLSNKSFFRVNLLKQ